jgi:hypothetical protein
MGDPEPQLETGKTRPKVVAATVKQGTGTNTVPVAPRSILKRPETTKEQKAELMKRWREGKFNKEEEQVATEAAKVYQQHTENETPEGTAERQGKARGAALKALQKWWDDGCQGLAQMSQPQHSAPAPATRPTAPKTSTTPRTSAAPHAPQQHTRAQRAAEVAALPETGIQRGGKKGKPMKEPAVLEPIRGSIPPDERRIIFERAAGAPQISPSVTTSAAGLVNIALSKVAPEHVRTETFRISD